MKTAALTRERDLTGSPATAAGLQRSTLFASLGVVLAVGTASALAGVFIPYLSPALGFACALGVPSVLLFGAIKIPDPAARLAISVTLAVLALIAAGLVANTVLPHLGARGPLGEVDVLATTDALCIALGLATWSWHPSRYPPFRVGLTTVERRLAVLSAAVVPMAAIGAVRLNNGLGNSATLLMLAVIVVDLALLVAFRQRFESAVVVPFCIYCIALALLFMTSLRGWYTTGHDVQRETRVFLLTLNHASWNVSRFPDAYNACLSITVLPTMLWQWMRMDSVYIYKVFFQLLFALCPVLVYRLSMRFGKPLISLLATIYFMSFVTFFQDMPMINRQEIAFLFLVAGLVLLFETHLTLLTRRTMFCVMVTGMVLAHYSTTYVTVGLITIAWVGRMVLAPLQSAITRLRPRISERFVVLRPSKEHALGFGVVAFTIAASFVWSTPLTHTSSGLSQTITSVVDTVRGGAAPSKSLDANYSILSTSNQTSDQLLGLYRTSIAHDTAAERSSGAFYQTSAVDQYATPSVGLSQLPLTLAGRTLSRLGINVASLNNSIRQGSARLLQLLIILGLAVVVFARRRLITAPLEFLCLAAAALIVVMLQVLLPVLSVNYGLLRTFQQTLIVLGVFLAAGSLALFPRRLGRWRVVGATAMALAFFASSTGMITESIGGYGPQMHLNNAGQYYDIYYLHPQEIAGIRWLESHAIGDNGNQVQAEIQSDRYTFNRFGSTTQLSALNDIYPSLIRRNAYVFLGYANVTTGQSTISFSGDLLTYRYPVEFLDTNKDLLYSNGGASVYR